MSSEIDIFNDYTTNLWNSENSPEQLYHYTNIEGAKSIISKSEFWTSSFETMNDNLELRKGLEIAKKDIHTAILEVLPYELGLAVNQSWSAFLEKENKSPKMRPFIACFTENNNSKTHWEEYANKSSGLALGFTKRFSLQNQRTGIFLKVEYDEFSARELFRLELKKVNAIFIQDWNNSTNQNALIKKSKFENLFFTYLQIIFKFSISLKNSKWANEQEWRLVIFSNPLSILPTQHGEIQFRSRGNELVDYISVNLLRCGYEIFGAKTGYDFNSNSHNSLNLLLQKYNLNLIQ